MRGSIVLPVLLLAALLAGALPTGAETGFGASIITYEVPVTVIAKGNATVAANSTANISIQLPFKPDPGAETTLAYRLTDANGSLLASASGVTIELLDADNNNTVISTILLSDGSPAEAIIPLSAAPSGQNLSVVVENSLASEVNAEVQVIIVESARFNVSVDPEKVQLRPGEAAQVTVTITQESGPAGQLRLSAYAPAGSGIETSVSPTSLMSAPGKTANVTWTIKADTGAKSGSYSLKLVGTFGYTIDGTNVEQEYTFAEIAIPATVAYAAGGFALGSLFGASFGWGAAVIAILIIIVLAAVALGLLK